MLRNLIMKQTHLLLLLGILLFLCYCNRDKIEAFGNTIEAFGNTIEAFGNQLIVPQFEFAILTPDQDPMSGYFQEEICRDDPTWTKGDKKCIDYSMDRNNCLDTGENGESAMDACPVSCDSCPSSVKIKRREPSPVEDVEEPDYSLFEEETGLLGATLYEGDVDYRDIYGRLDEINKKLEELNIGECPGSGGGGGGGGGTPTPPRPTPPRPTPRRPTPQAPTPSNEEGRCTFWWDELGIANMRRVLEEDLPNGSTKYGYCEPSHSASATGGRGVCENGIFRIQQDLQCVSCEMYNDHSPSGGMVSCDECAPVVGCTRATCKDGYINDPEDAGACISMD